MTVLLHPLCKNYLNAYCFRAFCASFPMVITMLGIFIFTSGRDGAVSRALSIKPLTWLSTLDAEIYLLQLGLNFALFPLFEACGITQYPILHFTMQFSSLIFVSWLVHHYYTRPIARLLTASQPDKGNWGQTEKFGIFHENNKLKVNTDKSAAFFIFPTRKLQFSNYLIISRFGAWERC